MSIVKRITVSVTNTHPSSSNATIVSTGVTNVPSFAQNTKQIKLAYIANYNINRYNGSFFSYKKQRFH